MTSAGCFSHFCSAHLRGWVTVISQWGPPLPIREPWGRVPCSWLWAIPSPLWEFGSELVDENLVSLPLQQIKAVSSPTWTQPKHGTVPEGHKQTLVPVQSLDGNKMTLRELHVACVSRSKISPISHRANAESHRTRGGGGTVTSLRPPLVSELKCLLYVSSVARQSQDIRKAWKNAIPTDFRVSSKKIPECTK